MSKLLYIEASPREDRSKSSIVSNAFIESYLSRNPGDEVEILSLWKVSLPSFDGDMLDAKYAVLHGHNHTPVQEAAWQSVADMVKTFTSADKYLFSTPMWNFSIPYKLKHYFDIIIQPGLTFSFNPEEGYKGLVTGKKAAIIYSRGGAYGPGSGAEDYDLQTKVLSGLLGFIGIIDQVNILVEPTLAAPDAVDKVIQAASAEARRIAGAF